MSATKKIKYAPVEMSKHGNLWITPEVLEGVKEIFKAHQSAYELLKGLAHGKTLFELQDGYIWLFMDDGNDMPIFEPLMADLVGKIESYLRTKYEGEVPSNFEFSYEVDSEKGYTYKTLHSSFWLIAGRDPRLFA